MIRMVLKVVEYYGSIPGGRLDVLVGGMLTFETHR